jgi:hypothetical protein
MEPQTSFSVFKLQIHHGAVIFGGRRWHLVDWNRVAPLIRSGPERLTKVGRGVGRQYAHVCHVGVRTLILECDKGAALVTPQFHVDVMDRIVRQMCKPPLAHRPDRHRADCGVVSSIKLTGGPLVARVST